MSITITQRGGEELRRKLARLQGAGADVMRRVLADANREHAAAFKRRAIPEDTGRLKASLTQTRHTDRIVTATKDAIKLGSSVPYAQYQRKRIRELSRAELKAIFVTPIHEHFDRLLRGVA